MARPRTRDRMRVASFVLERLLRPDEFGDAARDRAYLELRRLEFSDLEARDAVMRRVRLLQEA